MKKYAWHVMIGLLGLGLGTQLGAGYSPEREIQVAGRVSQLVESILVRDGNTVTRDRGITRIHGRKTELGLSLSMALETQLIGLEAHRKNIESHQVTGYKKKVVVTSPDQAPWLQEVHTQGSLQKTGNPFHLGIEGEGFFKVEMPNGETSYTRAGDFHYNGRTTQLTTSAGYPIGVKIPRSYSNIRIDATGEVSGISNESDDGNPDVLGQFKLVAFDFPSNLRPLSGGLYEVTDSVGARRDGVPGDRILKLGAVAQGHLEKSNVNFQPEMTALLEAERVCTLLSRCLNTLRPDVISI